MRNNPLHTPCLAKTRSGKPCQTAAMPNGRCRMHGGTSPGAPKGNKNAYKHGRYSNLAIDDRKFIQSLLSESRDLLKTF